MSTQVGDRIEVGECDLGHVFIFARTSADEDTWMVRAGNHTVGVYETQARAESVARVLCGDERLNNAYVADAPSPAATPVAATRPAVSRR